MIKYFQADYEITNLPPISRGLTMNSCTIVPVVCRLISVRKKWIQIKHFCLDKIDF